MKPKILLVSDDPHLDTGFGRVVREIGTGLVKSGQFEVAAIGWFQQSNDRFVPFRVYPTDRSSPEIARLDSYAAITYPRVVESFKPDLVIWIGDEWTVREAASLPRNHQFIAYVPIDSVPILPSWAATLKKCDMVVAMGSFGEVAMKQADPKLNVIKIPHAVDTEVFHPMSAEDKAKARLRLTESAKFIVGCVARNNARKNLPRLLKAFRQFLNPSITCTACGNVEFFSRTPRLDCPECGNTDDMVEIPGKFDVLLYLHSSAIDSAGHDLYQLIRRFNLLGHVGMPDQMAVGRGVPDYVLNELYNAMDVFTLPTSAEGFGLPILEAMSAGLPVLVTDYSGHVEYVKGAGEVIRIAEMETDQTTHGERAIVDLKDYVIKLDRFYYEREDFLRRWGPYLIACGVTAEQSANLLCGKALREEYAVKARERALTLQWTPIVGRWVSLVQSLLASSVTAETGLENEIEVEQV